MPFETHGSGRRPAGPAIPDFDAVYAADADPWRVLHGAYEQRKLTVLLAGLSQPRYEHVWDPACGTGALVRRLADRSSTVLASDLSPRAVALTEAHCTGLTRVVTEVVRLPDPPRSPGGPFDLTVLSEFLYYLPEPDRAATLTLVDRLAAPEAEIASVHWRPHPHDAYASGADIEREIAAHLLGAGWQRVVDHQEPEFVFSTFVRAEVSR